MVILKLYSFPERNHYDLKLCNKYFLFSQITNIEIVVHYINPQRQEGLFTISDLKYAIIWVIPRTRFNNAGLSLGL